MNQIIDNIKRGSVFSIERSNNEIIKDIYMSVDNINCYNYPTEKTSYRNALASDLRKVLGFYKQTHKLS